MNRAHRLRVLEPHVKDRGAHAALLTLEAIEALTLAEGLSPTLRDVARVRELTMAGVQHHVRILERSGLLEKRVKGHARAFRVAVTARADEEWIEVTKLTLSREQTRTDTAIYAAFSRAAEDALSRVDMEGSQVEFIIRHRP